MRLVPLHHPLHVGTLLLTPTTDIGKEALATRTLRSEGIESAEIKTQSRPVVKPWNGHRRTRLVQILDLLAEDNRLISNDVGNVKTHLLRSGRRSRLS